MEEVSGTEYLRLLLYKLLEMERRNQCEHGKLDQILHLVDGSDRRLKCGHVRPSLEVNIVLLVGHGTQQVLNSADLLPGSRVVVSQHAGSHELASGLLLWLCFLREEVRAEDLRDVASEALLVEFEGALYVSFDQLGEFLDVSEPTVRGFGGSRLAVSGLDGVAQGGAVLECVDFPVFGVKSFGLFV